jgi:murein DD-endopeptidase MepM/ murein hydrolase activator NlpD
MSKINIDAKKERHQKLYEGQYQSRAGKFWFHTKRCLQSAWRKIKPSGKRLSNFMHPLDHMPAPKRLYTQLSIWSIGLLLLTSVNVSNAAFEGGLGVGAEYPDLTLDLAATSMVTDEEGYLIKNMPLEGEAVYDLNRTELVTHEVQSGETLSVIAYRYGLNVSSIRYANSAITYSDYLKVGQQLEIPPKDGLYVDVGSGDTLVKLVDKYDADLEQTKLFNNIDEEAGLTSGGEIFMIDGEPEQVYVAATTYSSGSTASSAPPSTMYYDIPASAEGWIRPTQGNITQGYRWGHYAYDIADRSKPPLLAAASGTVTKASSGTWGGGYGNHVIIDHGNGYQTLYAHAEVLYVNTGDYVSQGQVIAKMGNTGRVYGATGIHLHFEITYNGVKQNPSIMGVW